MAPILTSHWGPLVMAATCSIITVITTTIGPAPGKDSSGVGGVGGATPGPSDSEAAASGSRANPPRGERVGQKVTSWHFLLNDHP